MYSSTEAYIPSDELPLYAQTNLILDVSDVY